MRKADFYRNTYEINDVSKVERKELTEICKKLVNGEAVRIFLPESEIDALFKRLGKWARGKIRNLSAKWPVLEEGETIASTTWQIGLP